MDEPCAQRTRLMPWDPNIDRQGPVSGERSLRLAGRVGVGLISRKGVQPRRREEKASGPASLLTAQRVYNSLRISALCQLPGQEEGLPCPRDLLDLAHDAKGGPTSGLCLFFPLPELLQEAGQRLRSSRKPLHCEY